MDYVIYKLDGLKISPDLRMLKPGTVTIILNIWKRNYVAQQLQAIYSQTVQADRIIILQNENHIDLKEILNRADSQTHRIDVIQSGFNWKYFGRFSLGSIIETEFVWILDDDIIPSSTWVEQAIKLCVEYNSIVCPTGRIVPRGSFTPERIEASEQRKYFIGDCFTNDSFNYCPALTFVDYGCNSYFFKSSWLKNFWNIWPVNFDLGEDIHLSGSCKILNEIRTLVPQQLSLAASGSTVKSYGFDVHASWRKQGFVATRERVIRYLTGRGWRPLLW